MPTLAVLCHVFRSTKKKRKKNPEKTHKRYLTSTQIFFDRQCGPPKNEHYIFGKFTNSTEDVDQGEKHLVVYLLADIKVY